MTDKQALKLALEAVHHRMKYYKPNANLYRIYGDRSFMSWSDKLTEFEQAATIIKRMMEVVR
jgi:hypothetical protein